MSRPTSSRVKIIVACLLSGLIAGLLTATQCERAGSDCRIAALQALSSEPAPWTLWLHWINWLPGTLFGAAFGLASEASGSSTASAPSNRIRDVALYALASTVIYVVASLVLSAFLLIASGDEFGLIVWVWPAGLTAGLVGAWLLAVAAKMLLTSPSGEIPALSQTWLPAVVGALLGLLFVLICTYGEQHILLAWPAAFSVWQIPVGLSLAALLRTPG